MSDMFLKFDPNRHAMYEEYVRFKKEGHPKRIATQAWRDYDDDPVMYTVLSVRAEVRAKFPYTNVQIVDYFDNIDGGLDSQTKKWIEKWRSRGYKVRTVVGTSYTKWDGGFVAYKGEMNYQIANICGSGDMFDHGS